MESVMLYVVAYDMPDDRRRTKVHKVLSGFGKWTQYSMFECFLTRKQLVMLQEKLKPHLRASLDSVRFYPMCEACVSKIETVGGALPMDEPVYMT